MIFKGRLRRSSLTYLVFILGITLTVFLMGCNSRSRESPTTRPSHLRKISDDPLIIQWEDNSETEDGYVVYVTTASTQVVEIVDPNVDVYDFGKKTCEVMEALGTPDGYSMSVEVLLFREGEQPVYRDDRSTGSLLVLNRYELDIGGDVPLISPNNLRFGLNPCSIGWDHNGTGFYECSDEGEEGFRVYLGVFPEGQVPSPDTSGWNLMATVGKLERSYSFNDLCSNVLQIDYGEELWAVVEAFTTNNKLGDQEQFSETVKIYHLEVPTFEPLDPATFVEWILPQHRLGDTVNGLEVLAPESIDFNGVYQTENIYQSFNSSVIIRGREEHPYVKITGKANNTYARAGAELQYWFQLVPKTSSVSMNEEIRVIINPRGNVNVSEGKSESTAHISVYTVVENTQNTTVVKACQNAALPTNCLDPSYSEMDVKYVYVLDFDQSNVVRVLITASFSLGNTGSAEVEILEPIIRIDPNQMIGDVLAKDLYKIIFSEGILPPDV